MECAQLLNQSIAFVIFLYVSKPINGNKWWNDGAEFSRCNRIQGYDALISIATEIKVTYSGHTDLCIMITAFNSLRNIRVPVVLRLILWHKAFLMSLERLLFAASRKRKWEQIQQELPISPQTDRATRYYVKQAHDEIQRPRKRNKYQIVPTMLQMLTRQFSSRSQFNVFAVYLQYFCRPYSFHLFSFFFLKKLNNCNPSKSSWFVTFYSTDSYLGMHNAQSQLWHS